MNICRKSEAPRATRKFLTGFVWVLPVLTIFIAGLFIQERSVFAAGESKNLIAPTISINPDIYYPLDEILYFEGRAKPSSTVEIQFQKQGARPLKFVAKSDVNGEWVLAEKVPLGAGDWEVRARLADGEKTSDWSNPRVIKAVVTGITIGGVTVKFTVIVLLLALSAIFIIYLLFRVKQEVRKKNEALIEEDFSSLRQDMLEELKHLGRKRELSVEEKEHRDKLLRDLERIEKEIGRKIRDI